MLRENKLWLHRHSRHLSTLWTCKSLINELGLKLQQWPQALNVTAMMTELRCRVLLNINVLSASGMKDLINLQLTLWLLISCSEVWMTGGCFSFFFLQLHSRMTTLITTCISTNCWLPLGAQWNKAVTTMPPINVKEFFHPCAFLCTLGFNNIHF